MRSPAASRYAIVLWRVTALVFGLFIFSVGIVMNVRANLGLGPWNVFHYGLTLITPLTLGQISQVVGLAMIVISLALGIKPGIATFSNMVMVGIFIDLAMVWIPDFYTPLSQYSILAAGIVLMGLGTALYIKAGYGAGPRDSFMLGLVSRLGWRVGVIRSLIEGTVLALGFLMGGHVGVGTALFVIAIGPAVDVSFVLMGVPVKREAGTLGRLIAGKGTPGAG